MDKTVGDIRMATVTAAYPANKNIFVTFIQCRTNVEDVGPTLCKCYTNVLCRRQWHQQKKTVIEIPEVL